MVDTRGQWLVPSYRPLCSSSGGRLHAHSQGCGGRSLGPDGKPLVAATGNACSWKVGGGISAWFRGLLGCWQWWVVGAPGKVGAVTTPTPETLSGGSGVCPPLESEMSAVASTTPGANASGALWPESPHVEKEAPLVVLPLPFHAPQQWHPASLEA